MQNPTTKDIDSYSKMQNPTVVYYANILCTNKITKNFTTNYTQTPYSSIILPKNIWFSNYNTQDHNTVALNQS